MANTVGSSDSAEYATEALNVFVVVQSQLDLGRGVA